MTRREYLEKLSFVNLKRPIRIKEVPNEDGRGPTNALLYVAEGIAQQAQKYQIRIEFVVQSGTKAAINFKEYKKLEKRYQGWVTVCRPIARHSIVELVKEGERVLPIKTAEKLLDYHLLKPNSKLSQYYRDECLDIQSEKYDAYICMGTPAAHIAAFEEKILVIEVFDHNWPLSLEHIIEDDFAENTHEWKTRRIRDIVGAEAKFQNGEWPVDWRDALLYDIMRNIILKQMREHDRMVHKVYMFPEPLAPGEFYCLWRALVPGGVKRIEGVLRGWDDNDLQRLKKEQREKLSSHWFQNPSRLQDTRIILVQGGGTPTWDRLLLKMVAQCLYSWEKRLGDTLFLFTKDSVKYAFERNPAVAKDWGWTKFSDLEDAISKSETIKFIADDVLDDFMMFYVVSNFVFSRPGGITVQDAIATRTPIGCAAEPGHWQTEKIRRHCELHETMESVKFEAFEVGGIGTIVDQFSASKKIDDMVNNMKKNFSNRQEVLLAEEILELISQRM